MPEELPKAYDPALIEEKWAKFWVDEHLFDVATPADSASIKPFVQLLPPPNVTGRLHMGHMLNQTEMDILTRWHRMSGDTSVWVPGTDHAGIATQMMVERQLKAEGKSRTDFTREEFTEKVWAWKHQYGNAITDQMRRLGASVDWSREYFTMDDRLSLAVKEAFVRLYEQGLIYRGAYIVNWDPILQTAVSDLEVESEERMGKLYFVQYPLSGVLGPYDHTNSIVIATTRPETMLGDTAVAVNPNDHRYKHLIGRKVQLPLTQREIPIIADDWANPEFGTGAVKVTPAHDTNDFAIGQRHPEIGSISILDKTAHIDLPGSPFHGKDRYEARDLIVRQLGDIGVLQQVKDHPMTVPISQRTGSVIEPRLSMQWFIKIQPLADKAIAAVKDGHVTFTPDNYRKTYMEWMNNIHDWCISRQLWWGHRIPAWHCDSCKHIMVAGTQPTNCSTCSYNKLTQDPDVLDTWFSSGLLPFTVFGWGESFDPIRGGGTLTPDLAAFYPTQLLVTGFDILFFWVARMIMLGCHFMLDVPMPDGSKRELKDAVPFREVYIHALVRDADRQKMSKTKGNVIDPIEIITKYGTDAVRFTLASQASPGTDIAFNEARTEGYRAFANKIWNAARFLQLQLTNAQAAGYKVTLQPTTASGAPPSTALSSRPGSTTSVLGSTGWSVGIGEADLSRGAYPPLETRWILSRLSTVSAEVAKSLADYRFDEASQSIYQFFWGEFCDWYVELVKLRLTFPRAEDLGALAPEPSALDPQAALTLNALVTVFEAALRLLSPFMPFLTEELWHALYASINQPAPAKSIALTRFPLPSDFPNDPAAVADMTTLQELIVTTRALRKELDAKEATPIQLYASEAISTLAQANADMLAKQARVSSVELSPAPLTGSNTRATPSFDIAIVYERQIDVPAERERLLRDLAKYNKGIEAAEKQLNNEGFLSKAPADKVEGLKKQHAETLALRDKAQKALDDLPPA